MPGSSAEGAETRNHILREAERLFATHGYDGVSMREIAEACHLTKANIYYYFQDKEALYVQILEADMLTLIQTLSKASQGRGTCRERLARVMETFMELTRTKTTLIQMTMRQFGGLEREIRGLVSRYRRELMQPFEQIIREGIQNGELRSLDPQLAALSFIGMMSILLTPALLDIPLETVETEIIPHTIDLFMAGAATR